MILPLLAIGLIGAWVGEKQEAIAGAPTEVWTQYISAQPQPMSVALEASWKEGRTVASPAWQGIVTDRIDNLPSELVTGTEVIQVDGIWRISVNSPMPFFRPLAQGSEGQDVAMLNAVLTELGWSIYSGDDWTPATTTGVRLLAERLGAGKTTETFDPSWFIWIPESRFVGAVIPAQVGEQAPSPGTPAILESAQLASLRLDPGDENGVPAMAGEWMIQTSNGSYDYTGDPANPIDRRDIFSASFTSSPEKIDAHLVPSEDQKFVAVPTSSVIIGDQSERCIYTEGQSQSTVVKVLGGGIGKTYIDGADLDLSGRVLANPSEVLSELTCS